MSKLVDWPTRSLKQIIPNEKEMTDPEMISLSQAIKEGKIQVGKQSPLQEAAWDLSIAIANHEDTFQPLMKFAKEVMKSSGVVVKP